MKKVVTQKLCKNIYRKKLMQKAMGYGVCKFDVERAWQCLD